MSSDYVLNELRRLEALITAHCEDHHFPYHDHLLDGEEHDALHARKEPQDKRRGERRNAG